jgi:hypothetical protein
LILELEEMLLPKFLCQFKTKVNGDLQETVFVKVPHAVVASGSVLLSRRNQALPNPIVVRKGI